MRLWRLVTRRRLVPTSHSLADLDTVSVPTVYGKLDCLLTRGRQNGENVPQNAGPVMIGDGVYSRCHMSGGRTRCPAPREFASLGAAWEFR